MPWSVYKQRREREPFPLSGVESTVSQSSHRASAATASAAVAEDDAAGFESIEMHARLFLLVTREHSSLRPTDDDDSPAAFKSMAGQRGRNGYRNFRIAIVNYGQRFQEINRSSD